MAIAVIGGLIFSTLLSLVFVPAFFTMMDGASRIGLRFAKRIMGGKEIEIAGNKDIKANKAGARDHSNQSSTIPSTATAELSE
jgi:hypothetical protein